MPRQPGAKAIIVYKGKLLLVLRDNIPTIAHPNMWNTPGGAIEEGESPLQAVIREIEEEVCFTPSHVIDVGSTTYQDGTVVYRYFVPVTETEFPQITLGNEGQKIGWFTFEELDRPDITPHSKRYYETHESMIRRMLAGEVDFAPIHEVVDVH